jgi:hypothetical protein
VRLKAVCSFLASLAILCAQSPSRIATGLENIKASELKTELTHISSDQFEGRLSLAPGSDLVIKWIAAEFKKAGLKPIAGDSYLQPVPLIDYRADRQANSLTLRISGKEEVFSRARCNQQFPQSGRRQRAGGLRRIRHHRAGTALRRLRRARRARQDRVGV